MNGSDVDIENIAIGGTGRDYIRLGRDFVPHEPRSTGGREYFTGKNGASGSYPTLGTMVFTTTGPNAHFPYVPYRYPHPLTGAPNLGLAAARVGGSVTLSWAAIPGTASYKVSSNWQDVASRTSAQPQARTAAMTDARTVLDANGRIVDGSRGGRLRGAAAASMAPGVCFVRAQQGGAYRAVTSRRR